MGTGTLLTLWVIVWALYGGIVTYVVYRRAGHRGLPGFGIGLLLGAIGNALFVFAIPESEILDSAARAVMGAFGSFLLLIPLWLLLSRQGKRCPYCFEIADPSATTCPHCGRDFPGLAAWRPDGSVPILSVRGLTVEYAVRQGRLVAVDRVNLDVYPGELVALVGESGCGKSTLAYSLIRHVTFPGEITAGQIFFKGRDVLTMTPEQLRQFRWRDIAVVFQAAQNAMNPVMRIADQMIDTVQAHEQMDREHILRRAAELLEMVRLEPDRVLRSYPFELSGGMRQRVIIALSLILEPEMLILDEPTTALDVVTQVHILDILREIRDRLGLTMLLLTHDMAIVARVADRVAVMYAGKIVEVGGINDIFYHGLHPYTRGLINAAPSLVGDLSGKSPIPGSPPNFLNMPTGCRFHPRCKYAVPKCRERVPIMESVDGRQVACHRWREIANMEA